MQYSQQQVSRSRLLRSCQYLSPPRQYIAAINNNSQPQTNLVSTFSQRKRCTAYYAQTKNNLMLSQCRSKMMLQESEQLYLGKLEKKLKYEQMPQFRPATGNEIDKRIAEVRCRLQQEQEQLQQQLVEQVQQLIYEIQCKNTIGILTNLRKVQIQDFLLENVESFSNDFSRIGGQPHVWQQQLDIYDFCKASGIEICIPGHNEFSIKLATEMQGSYLSQYIAQLIVKTRKFEPLSFTVSEICTTVAQRQRNLLSSKLQGKQLICPDIATEQHLLEKQRRSLQKNIAICQNELETYQNVAQSAQSWDNKYNILVQVLQFVLQDDNYNDIILLFQIFENRINEVLRQIQQFSTQEWGICERVMKQRVSHERECRYAAQLAELDEKWKKVKPTQLRELVGRKPMSRSFGTLKRQIFQ